jgi:hypothetical protein
LAGQPLKLTFPELFSFAKKPAISLKSAISVDSVSDLFHLPLTEEAFGQFQQLESLFQNLHMTDATNVWGNSLLSTKNILPLEAIKLDSSSFQMVVEVLMPTQT